MNPWFILSALAAFVVSAFLYGQHTETQGRAAVQQAWDHSITVQEQARAKRIGDMRAIETDLQRKADADRKAQYERTQILDARLGDALRELRNRPQRPAAGTADVPQSAGTGTGSGCTGAGLYSDDAEFLTRQADFAQRIRNQRDACYARYRDAQAAMKRTAP